MVVHDAEARDVNAAEHGGAVKRVQQRLLRLVRLEQVVLPHDAGHHMIACAPVRLYAFCPCHFILLSMLFDLFRLRHPRHEDMIANSGERSVT